MPLKTHETTEATETTEVIKATEAIQPRNCGVIEG